MRALRQSLPALITFGVLNLALGGEPATAPAGPGAELFEAKVRPLLLDACVRCHGAKKQSSGLRLDSRAALLEGGENGPAVVPGDPQKSLLVQAIRYAHEDIHMPPKGKLPEPAIEALTEWVRTGAHWPEGKVLSADDRDKASEGHWAFQPVRDVVPPAVKDSGWIATPVDAFVQANLEKRGISPSPRADRRTLIRRATFDLTGLPPTAEEVDAFANDPAPDAFAKVVDRLLASPRYGERWGRHWLDVARYADTKGYVFTEERRYPYAYTYRDYVIHAFNDDLPYDQFVIEQIAADRLPASADTRPLAAMGFLTVGRRFLNDTNDIIDDRIDVVSRGLLGLTVTCARCHDHKFDPIPSDDYYSLYGVFASSVEPADLPTISGSGSEPRASEFERQLKARRAEVDAFVASKRQDIRADLRKRVDAYFLAAFDLDFNPRHPKFDERVRADKLVPQRLRWVMGRWKPALENTHPGAMTIFAPWQALARLTESDLARKAAETTRELSRRAMVNPIIMRAFADRPPTRRREIAERYASVFARTGQAIKDAQKMAQAEKDAWASIELLLDREDGPLGVPADGLRRLLDRSDRNRFQALTSAVDSLAATHPGAPPRAMVMRDAPRPIEPHVFIRGNPGRPGKPVPRQFLKVLSGPARTPFGAGSGRLELARAIASPTNPLTARVMVNRIWLNHFGVGLAGSPSDFGLRSDAPAYPELLDFLAGQFVKNGWSIKAMHRLIMLSSAYQQRSDVPPAARERDPDNRLFASFPRRRLDFESMRDAILAVSGTLDGTVGGRPVPILDPPFPPRRTVYGFIDRQNLDGVYRSFDFASPDATSPRRFVTTVPQQALFLMNSPFVIEQAQKLAAGLEPTAAPEERIRTLYRKVLGRMPESHEREIALRFIAQQSERGAAAAPRKLSPWEEYAQVLLLTNEFMFVD